MNEKLKDVLTTWNRDRMLVLLAVLWGTCAVLGVIQMTRSSSSNGGSMFSGLKGRVAVVALEGPIQDQMTDSAWGRGDALDVAERLYRISKDDSIKAIVLRINSPGGTVAAVQEIHAELLRCKQKGKKIVASIGDVAASGGYYLAAPADQIVANPGSLVGSIGVILQMSNMEGLFKKIGFQLQVVKRGRYKDMGSPARALTEEERALLQASVEDSYQQFLKAVADGRKKTIAQIEPYADGRVMTGQQALTIGFVDRLGGYREAIRVARELAGLPEDAPLIYENAKGLRSLLKNMESIIHLLPFQAKSLMGSDSSFQLEYRWQ